MTTTSSSPEVPDKPETIRTPIWGVAGVIVCALIWGTTWYGITLQFGTVAPLASIVYRFGLAALVLFAVCRVLRLPLRLSRAQHLAALGQGAFAFSLSYSGTYAAEHHVASAIVAVVFASLTFLNLVLFRLAAGQKAGLGSWGGAILGVVGVAVLSGGEIIKSGFDHEVVLGIGLAFAATTASAIGNYFAWRGQEAGSGAIPALAWAMVYGTGLLVIYGLATGVAFTFEPTARYVGSLLYLSLVGSVVAFGIYFTIARLIGYALASYISALTPPIAMLVSVLFEGAKFGWTALVGLLIVLSGQALLIRSKRP